MATVLTVGGSTIAVPSAVLLGRLCTFTRGGFPELTFFTRGLALPGLPDPYLGKAVALTVSGTSYFVGDVVHGPDPGFDDRFGWICAYTCLGLRNRMDWLPHTDSNTGTDTSVFNPQPEDPSYIASRAGRTVGQILTACLTMTTNANALDARGIGAYTGLPSAPALPAATVSDLAALTVIPPAPVYFSGEKLGSAIEGFLSQWAPNHLFHVQPADGKLRFLDMRTFTDHTFTLDTDPIEPTPLHRTCAENFQRVVVRGSPLVEAFMLTKSSGDLVEDFAHDGLTNTQAKTNWTAADFQQPGFPPGQALATANIVGTAVNSATMNAGGYGYGSTPAVSVTGDGSGAVYTANLTSGAVTSLSKTSGGTGYTHATITIEAPAAANADDGTCTCPSTTTVTVTSSHANYRWSSNFWDQTSSGRHGMLFLRYSLGSGITQFTSRRVVSNTSLSPGGTSTLTLDLALAVTNYDSYALIGTSGGASSVWRQYSIANAAVGAALANFFPFPQPFRLAGGNAVTLTSSPMGSVLFGSGPPYSEVTLAFTGDPSTGKILFAQPTYIVAGNAVPADVRALCAVNVGANTATYPADIATVPQYAGTSHSVEGLEKTLTVTIEAWRDPANQSSMNAYASDLLDSVKDTIVEGTIRYLGLYTAALTPGTAASVTGATFTTGWESLALPVVECELEWPQGEGANYVTTLHCSNRRAQLTSAAFLKPDRTGLSLGVESGSEGFNLAGYAGALPTFDPGGGNALAGRALGAMDASGTLAGMDASGTVAGLSAAIESGPASHGPPPGDYTGGWAEQALRDAGHDG